MKIVVTGAAGYLGAELIRMLSHSYRKIDQLILVDDLSSGNKNIFINASLGNACPIQFYSCSILETHKLKKIVNDVDVVVHLAARVKTPFANENPHEFEMINHWGTSELIDVCVRQGVKRFIYASSTAVFGVSNHLISIDDVPNPITSYAVSKYRGELQIMVHAKKLNISIVRLGTVFGYAPCMRFDTVVNKMAFDARFKKRIHIHGDGTQKRSIIHIGKAAELFYNQIFTNDIEFPLVHGIEHHVTINQLGEKFSKLVSGLEIVRINHPVKYLGAQISPYPTNWFAPVNLGKQLKTLLDSFS